MHDIEQCIKEILSIGHVKTILQDLDSVKKNNLYNTVVSNAVEDLSRLCSSLEDNIKNSINLIKIGVLYDTVYNRLHTGQWNAVEESEREMFSFLTYLRIVYTLCVSKDPELALKDGIYLADLGLMLGTRIIAKPSSASNDLLTETASILTNHLSKSNSHEPPLKRLKLNGDVHETSAGSAESKETHSIPVLECPSLEYFGTNCYDQQHPALLKGIIGNWPAMERWHDPNYLLSVAGERTVPIEIGSQYSNDDWSQKLMKFREFVEQNICNEANSFSNSVRAAYLAQHDLFDQIPALRRDIVVPDYIGRTDAHPRIKAWLGPKGTVSPLHTDPCHNLLCQVFGAKTVILAPPADTERLYPHDHFILSNTSQVDARQPDYERFPLVRDVSFHRLTLRRGEVLYIPPKWWHYVESLSPSFSVSFWFE